MFCATGHLSLHDAENAAKILGTADDPKGGGQDHLDGAPIHGTTHMSQFTPLCLDVLRAAWFQRGSLSVHFLRMVSHLMPIQAHIRRPQPGQTQVECGITFEDGELVLQGTASCGERRAEDGPSMVEQRLAKVVAPPVGPERFGLALAAHPPLERSFVRRLVLHLVTSQRDVSRQGQQLHRFDLPEEAVTALEVDRVEDATRCRWRDDRIAVTLNLGFWPSEAGELAPHLQYMGFSTSVLITHTGFLQAM